MLSLSSRICGSSDWLGFVVPTTDTEGEDDSTLVLGAFLSCNALYYADDATIALRDPGSIFTDKVQTHAEALQTALLTYQSIATRKKAGTNAFRPIYLPSLQYNERTGSLSGSSFSELLRVDIDEIGCSSDAW